MNDSQDSPDPALSQNPEAWRSALFAQLIMQQSSMAMMLLGKSAHPQTGEIIRDVEAARLFIDQMEMLEHKTKGNLTQEETALLQQSLMSVRMAFVEAVDSPAAQAASKPKESSSPLSAGPGSEAPPPEPLTGGGPAEAESRKKFTKKY
jgi:hypothetical protein